MTVPNPRMDFLVIGAQKCATSWIYYCLRDHPDLRLPQKKLEVEYLGGPLYEERGADWYFGLVGERQDDTRLGDVSVEYLWDENAAPVVGKLLPGVKLIAILRQPIDRAMSAYYWYVRKARLPDDGVAAGLEASLAAVQGSDRSDPAYELVARGLYAPQLQRYLDHVGRDQLLVLTYDEIARDPAAVMKEVYSFIGVDDTHVPESLGERPKQNAYMAPLIRLERAFPHSRVVSKLADLASIWISRRGLARQRPDLPDALYEQLASFFAADLRRTRAILADSATIPESRLRIIDGWMAELGSTGSHPNPVLAQSK